MPIAQKNTMQLLPLRDSPDHIRTAVFAPVRKLEPLPEDGVVAELVPLLADGQHRANDVPRGKV